MLQIPAENKLYIKVLSQLIEANFTKERVIFLGLHGSSRYDSLAPKYTSDIDLELILDNVSSRDLLIIKDIVTRIPLKVECQVRSLYEVKEPQSLIHRTKYKIFMYFAYGNGITLLGKNIYKDIQNLFDDHQYKESLLISIQLAWKDLRKGFITDMQTHEINKIIEVFLFDALLYLGVIDYKQLDMKKLYTSKRYKVYKMAANFFSNIFSTEEIFFLIDYQQMHIKDISDVKIVDCLDKIMRNIEHRYIESYSTQY